MAIVQYKQNFDFFETILEFLLPSLDDYITFVLFLDHYMADNSEVGHLYGLYNSNFS